MMKRTAVQIAITGFIVVMFFFNMAMNVVSQGKVDIQTGSLKP